MMKPEADAIKKMALIVEDEPEAANLLRELLAAHGYDSEVAGNGRDGFRRATTNHYDLFVVDVNLPDVDGVTMLNSLSITGSKLPVIVATGEDPDVIAYKLDNPHVVGVLVKPYDLAAFDNLVKLARERLV